MKQLIEMKSAREIMQYYLKESEEHFSNTRFQNTLASYLHTLMLNGDGELIECNSDWCESITEFTLNDAEKQFFGLKTDKVRMQIDSTGYVMA